MYRAKNIDTDKALKALEKAREAQRQECERKMNETQIYYEGFTKGLDFAENIFYCPNYEKEGENG